MNTETDPIRIRTATREDVPLLLAMIRELAEYEKLSHEVVATEAILAESLFGRRPAAEAMIGEIDGAPAAYMIYFHNFSTFLGIHGIYLEDIYVRPSHRGSGLGRRMLQHLAKLAVERNCGRVEWAVLDWNEPAIAFYQSLGASASDGWTVYGLKGDALRKLAAQS